MQCPKCKALASDGAKFCPKCGYTFSAGAPAAPVQPSYQSYQPSSEPLYPDTSYQGGYDTGSFDPFAAQGTDPYGGYGSDQFGGSYDPYQQSMQLYQEQTSYAMSPDSSYQYPSTSQPVASPPQYGTQGPAVQPSSSSVKKVVFAVLDVVIMLLMSVAPWIGLDPNTQSALSYFYQGDTSWSLPSCGYHLLTDIAPGMRNLASFVSDSSMSDAATFVTVLGGFLMLLWFANMASLVATLVADVKSGRGKGLGYILPILSCILVIVVFLLVGAGVLSEMSQYGDTSGVTSEVFSYVLSLLKFGLWGTLLTSIGGIVARIAIK